MIQNSVLRIIGFHHLADIVNRHSPISKQKMFLRLRRKPQGIGYRGSGLGNNKKRVEKFSPLLSCGPCLFPIPNTLYPRPCYSMMAIASISINASGLTSAFTTTPVAAGNPFLKYVLRTAAVSPYLSRVVM